jgi:hypothetical protein
MVRPYRITDHYWIVAGSTTQVFSSKAKAYVLVTDAVYLAWVARGYSPTKIATEAGLWDVLAEQAPECLPDTPAATEARRTRLISRLDALEIGRVVATALFNHENRIRALEKKQPITKAQFIAALKEML